MDESSLGTIVFNWIIVFLLLLVNAFFVSAGFAIVRARKTRIEQLTQRTREIPLFDNINLTKDMSYQQDKLV